MMRVLSCLRPRYMAFGTDIMQTLRYAIPVMVVVVSLAALGDHMNDPCEDDERKQNSDRSGATALLDAGSFLYLVFYYSLYLWPAWRTRNLWQDKRTSPPTILALLGHAMGFASITTEWLGGSAAAEMMVPVCGLILVLGLLFGNLRQPHTERHGGWLLFAIFTHANAPAMISFFLVYVDASETAFGGLLRVILIQLINQSLVLSALKYTKFALTPATAAPLLFGLLLYVDTFATLVFISPTASGKYRSLDDASFWVFVVLEVGITVSRDLGLFHTFLESVAPHVGPFIRARLAGISESADRLWVGEKQRRAASLWVKSEQKKSARVSAIHRHVVGALHGRAARSRAMVSASKRRRCIVLFVDPLRVTCVFCSSSFESRAGPPSSASRDGLPLAGERPHGVGLGDRRGRRRRRHLTERRGRLVHHARHHVVRSSPGDGGGHHRAADPGNDDLRDARAPPAGGTTRQGDAHRRSIVPRRRQGHGSGRHGRFLAAGVVPEEGRGVPDGAARAGRSRDRDVDVARKLEVTDRGRHGAFGSYSSLLRRPILMRHVISISMEVPDRGRREQRDDVDPVRQLLAAAHRRPRRRRPDELLRLPGRREARRAVLQQHRDRRRPLVPSASLAPRC